MAGKVRPWANRKKYFWNFSSGKFQNFLEPQFQFNKKIIFFRVWQILQLYGASGVYPSKFFLKAY